MASVQIFLIIKQAEISFQLWPLPFRDSFSILFLSLNSVFLGNAFFRKHNNTIDKKKNLLQLQNLTEKLHQFFTEKSNKSLHEEITKNSPDFDKKSPTCNLSRKYLWNEYWRNFLITTNHVVVQLFPTAAYKINAVLLLLRLLAKLMIMVKSSFRSNTPINELRQKIKLK